MSTQPIQTPHTINDYSTTFYALHTNDLTIPEHKVLADNLVYLEEVSGDVGLLAVVAPGQDQYPVSIRELYDQYEDCGFLSLFNQDDEKDTENTENTFFGNFTGSIVHIIADPTLNTQGIFAKIKEIYDTFTVASVNGYFGPETRNDLNIILAYNPGIELDTLLNEWNEELKVAHNNSMLPIEYSIQVAYVSNLAKRLTPASIDAIFNKDQADQIDQVDQSGTSGSVGNSYGEIFAVHSMETSTRPKSILFGPIFDCVAKPNKTMKLRDGIFRVSAKALYDIYQGTFAEELNVLAMVNGISPDEATKLTSYFGIDSNFIGTNPLSKRSLRDLSKIKYVSIPGTQHAADLVYSHAMTRMAKSSEYLITKIIPGLIDAGNKTIGREHREDTDINIGYFGVITEGARVFENQVQEISEYLSKINEETGSNHRILVIDVKEPIGTELEVLTTPFNYDLIIIGNDDYINLSKGNKTTYAEIASKLENRYCSIFDVSSLTLVK